MYIVRSQYATCLCGWCFLFLSSPGTILSETDTEAEQLSQEDYPDVPDNEKFHLMADIYSYGQLMAYTLTGRMPWQRLDSLSVTEGMIQKGDRVEIPEQLSGQLRNIIPRCRKKKPKSRPSAKRLVMHYYSGKRRPL